MGSGRGRKNGPQKSKPTARETYPARRSDIARLMDLLQMEFNKHAEGAKADPHNWGFPGSLVKVRSDLIELVGFLSNLNPEHVEAYPNDSEWPESPAARGNAMNIRTIVIEG